MENNIQSTESVPTQSVWGCLISLIDKPKDTFGNLTARPRLKWVLPLALAIVIAVFNAWVTAPHSSELAQKAAVQQLTASGMSPAEIEQATTQAARFQTPTFLGIVSAVTGSLFIVLAWLAAAALLYFLSLVAGAEFTYGAAFTVMAWSTIPTTLRSLVQGILIAVTGRFPVYTGLAALQVSGDVLVDSRNPMIALLSFADIFWLWHIFLLVIGMAVAAKFSRLKAFWIVLVYAALAVGLGIGSSFLSRLGG